jgi:RNA polymerase sigma factor (sigma-70 family)
MLLDQLKTGSQDETSLILTELQLLLGAELHKYVNHRFDSQGKVFVEELLQQTWIKVWRNMDQCHGVSCQSILAWIKKTALRTGLNMIRDDREFDELLRLEREHPSGEDGNSLCDEVSLIPQESGKTAASMWRPTEDQVIFSDLMQQWRASLTDQERKVFLLCLGGYSKSEIADMLNISRPRVSQYIEQIYRKNAGIGW